MASTEEPQLDAPLPPVHFSDNVPPPPTPAPPAKKPWPWMHLLIGLILIAAVLLRWSRLDAQSLWLDEGMTAWLAGVSLAEMVAFMRQDASFPLLFVLLKPWTVAMGTSEIALRGLSALMATISLGVFYRLALGLLQRASAVVVAMGLMAVSVMQIQYAKEARYYALLSLLVLIMLEAARTWTQSRSRWAMALLILAGAASLYTHQLAIVYIAAIDLAWLLMPGHVKLRDRVWPIILSNVAIGLLYLPWLPVALDQMRWTSANFWASVPDRFELLRTLATVGGAKPYALASLFSAAGLYRLANWEMLTLVVLGLLGMIVLVAIVARPRVVGVLLIVALLPVVGVYVYSHFGRPVFGERLFIASSPLIPLLAAAMLTRRYSAWVGWPLVVALLCVSVLSVYAFERHEQKEQWREAYRHVQSMPPDHRRLVIFLAAEGQLVFDYYAQRTPGPPPWTQATGAPQGFFDSDPPQVLMRVNHVRELLPMRRTIAQGHFDEVVLVLSHEWLADPEGVVTRWLRREWGIPQTRRFKDVTVHRYTRQFHAEDEQSARR